MDVRRVTEIGDIEIEIDDAAPQAASILFPLQLQDGTEIALLFGAPEIKTIWEFLSAVRRQKPGVFGLQ